MGPRPEPLPSLGSVTHWPSSMFKKIWKHMSQWSKRNRSGQTGHLHPIDRANAIIEVAAEFACTHPCPPKPVDTKEEEPRNHLANNPNSTSMGVDRPQGQNQHETSTTQPTQVL